MQHLQMLVPVSRKIAVLKSEPDSARQVRLKRKGVPYFCRAVLFHDFCTSYTNQLFPRSSPNISARVFCYRKDDTHQAPIVSLNRLKSLSVVNIKSSINSKPQPAEMIFAHRNNFSAG